MDFSTEIDMLERTATFTFVKAFQPVGRIRVFFLFTTPKLHQGMICFFNLPILGPLGAEMLRSKLT